MFIQLHYIKYIRIDFAGSIQITILFSQTIVNHLVTKAIVSKRTRQTSAGLYTPLVSDRTRNAGPGGHVKSRM